VQTSGEGRVNFFDFVRTNCSFRICNISKHFTLKLFISLEFYTTLVKSFSIIHDSLVHLVNQILILFGFISAKLLDISVHFLLQFYAVLSFKYTGINITSKNYSKPIHRNGSARANPPTGNPWRSKLDNMKYFSTEIMIILTSMN